MFYSGIKDFDVANGPGIRVSLFVSGCPHHCPGCFNPETWEMNAGYPFTSYDRERIIALLKQDGIKGLSILGGEPFAPYNVYEVADLINKVRTAIPELDIWVYTGYTIEELCERLSPTYRVDRPVQSYGTVGILAMASILVDGRFIEELKDLKLRFRGSSNQRIIDLSRSKIDFPQMYSEMGPNAPWGVKELVLAEEYM